MTEPVSPVTFREPGAGKTMRLGPGEFLTELATGEQTSGHYTLYEVVSAVGSGVPLHEHPWDEAFYILSGEYEIRYIDEQDEVQTAIATPGAFVHVSGGNLHAYRPLGEGCKMLSLNQPVGLEPIVRKAGLPVSAPLAIPEQEPLPMDQFSAIFAEGGIRVDQERLAAEGGVGAWKEDES